MSIPDCDRGPRFARGGLIAYPLLLMAALAYVVHPRVVSSTTANTFGPPPGHSSAPSGQAEAQPPFLLTAQAAAPTVVASGPQSKIVFQQTTIDLGERNSGEELRVTWPYPYRRRLRYRH